MASSINSNASFIQSSAPRADSSCRLKDPKGDILQKVVRESVEKNASDKARRVAEILSEKDVQRLELEQKTLSSCLQLACNLNSGDMGLTPDQTTRLTKIIQIFEESVSKSPSTNSRVFSVRVASNLDKLFDLMKELPIFDLQKGNVEKNS